MNKINFMAKKVTNKNHNAENIYMNKIDFISTIDNFFHSFKMEIYIIAVFLISFAFGRIFEKYKNLKNAKSVRQDAIKRSRSVLGGLLAEQVAPFLPGFPCSPLDVRFIGKPIDFIAFKGAGRDEKISEIIFIEVKSGTSELSGREREIKAAVEEGRVRYEVYRVQDSIYGGKS